MEKYYHEIDCLRGIAIVAIILRHTLVGTFLDINVFPDRYFECLTLFAVPLFFFISGFSLTIRYKDVKKMKVLDFYRNRFSWLLVIYLLWSFIYMAFVYYGDFIFKLIVGISFENQIPLSFFIVKYFLAVLTGNIRTFWFIIVIFQFYLIFPILLKIYKKLNFWFKQFFMIIIILGTLLSYYLGYIGINIIFLKHNYTILNLEIENILINVNIARLFWIIPFLIYFLIGMNIAFNWIHLKKILKKYYIRILIVILYFWSFLSFPYLENVLFPPNSDVFAYFNFNVLIYSLSSILFYLMVFNDVKFVEKEHLITNNFSDSGQKNLKFILSKVKFERKVTSQISKFFWTIGQFSLGIFLTHRTIMIIIQNSLYYVFNFNIDPKQPKLTRFEALGLSLLYFALTLCVSTMLTYILWRSPKGNFVIGKKSKWID